MAIAALLLRTRPHSPRVEVMSAGAFCCAHDPHGGFLGFSTMLDWRWFIRWHRGRLAMCHTVAFAPHSAAGRGLFFARPPLRIRKLRLAWFSGRGAVVRMVLAALLLTYPRGRTRPALG